MKRERPKWSKYSTVHSKKQTHGSHLLGSIAVGYFSHIIIQLSVIVSFPFATFHFMSYIFQRDTIIPVTGLIRWLHHSSFSLPLSSHLVSPLFLWGEIEWCIDGLVWDCGGSIANELELLWSCSGPSIYYCSIPLQHNAYGYRTPLNLMIFPPPCRETHASGYCLYVLPSAQHF